MSTKLWSATFLDPALDDLIAHGNKLVLCSAEPTTYTEALTTYALADRTVSSGEYTKGNGAVSGRKVRLAPATGVTVDVSGEAEYYAILDTVNLDIRHVGRYTGVPLVASSVIATGEIVIEIRDPF